MESFFLLICLVPDSRRPGGKYVQVARMHDAFGVWLRVEGSELRVWGSGLSV